MSSIKAKAKISLVAILSIFSILTFGYLLNTGKSQAGWLSGWSYRIPITITEQSGNVLTDYQVLVTLDTASLISAGKMRSDCGDVRFTDSDGTTLLNYWLEGGCNSTNTKIWVKVPNIPANSSKIIYVYYGNPSATSASNGDATFDFFDDFIGTSLDTSKWTLGYASYEGASVTVSNGLALIKSISGDFEAIHSNYVIFNTDTKVIEAKTKILSTDIEPHFFFLVSSDNADSVRFGLREDYLDTAGNVIIVQFKAYGSYGYGYLYYDVGNEWFIARITKFDIGSFEGRVMDLNYNTLGNSFGAGTSDWENYNWWIGVFVRDSYGFYWDWVRVRKYTNPEPTILLGSEETAGGPTPSPPGWLSGWSYRIPITIGNTQNPNTLTDYQVLVVLDTQSLISQGKMRSDCGDIRFTDSDGQILLSYWIEPGCNSPNTRIWVKVPNIPASSTKTIYIYYGNPSATSQSDGYSTFLAFNLLFDGPIGGRNSMGGIHTCVLLSDGTAKCWGWNYFGQLGDGTTTDRYTPVNVSGLTNAVAIAVGDYHTCALLSDGTAKCWGRNDHGRLGDGTTENRYTPVSVLNYNFGGRYDKTNGIWTIQKPPYFMDTYFVRAYTDPEPTTILGSEETPPAPLGPNISSCGQITQPGSYVLVSDLQLPSGQPYCIKISSSDVEIDCQGHKIVDNSGNPNSTAILIDGYNDRITISNCIIEGFKVGIGAYDDVSRIYTYYNVFNNSEYAVWFNSVWVFNLKFSSLYNSRIYIIGDNVEIEYSNFTYVNTNADSIFGVYNYGFGNNYINITNYNYNSPMLVRFFINDSRFVYIYDNVIHISNTSYVEPYVNDSTFLIVISGEYIRHYYINGNQIYAKYPNGGSVVFDSSTGLVENVDIFDNYIESTGRYCLQIGRGYGFYVKYNTILDGCILLVGYTGQANYNFIHDNMISSFAILGNNNNIYYIYSSNNIIWGNMTKAPGAKILYLDSLYGTKLYGNTIYHPEYEVWGPEFIETYETFVSVVFGLNLVGFNQTTMEKLIKKEIPYAEIKIPMNISTNRIDYKIVINSTDLVNGEYYIPRSVFDFWIETTDGYKFANVGYENVFTILKQDINASYYFDLRMTNNIPIVPPGTYVGNVTIDIYAGELAENQFVDVDIGGVNVEIV